MVKKMTNYQFRDFTFSSRNVIAEFKGEFSVLPQSPTCNPKTPATPGRLCETSYRQNETLKHSEEKS